MQVASSEAGQREFKNLPLFSLLTPSDDVVTPGSLVASEPHEHAKGGVVTGFDIPEGRIILTYWKGQLHEVIYQTPHKSRRSALERNEYLFLHYGQGLTWTEVLDNGFGKSYRRHDLERYALWSYAMDYVTFGSMQFHEVKRG